ncbi:MAG: hypothetical protein EZS28_002185 [Streblomastix strix]|uniref:Cilia- and flagella-associated protein 47 domain-containing protein n=1 Tax=Streblomastix strix TaxID=222440 RepID=A0A5J4X625_9EUKA|nr:MAG: hypothetical protein EZS28_002185 [Streblomastix strix]
MVISFFPQEARAYNMTIPLFLDEDEIEYITVEISELQTLSLNKQQIVADVVFQPRKAASFTAQIVFYDQLAVPYILPINAIADNSVLTTTGFLLANWKIGRIYCEKIDGIPMLKDDQQGVELDIQAEKQAIQAALDQNKEKQENKDDMMPGRLNSLQHFQQKNAPSKQSQPKLAQQQLAQQQQQQQQQAQGNPQGLGGGQYGVNFTTTLLPSFGQPNYPSSLGNILLKFMNTNLLTSQIVSWPYSAIEQYGIPIFEAIEHLMNISIPSKTSNGLEGQNPSLLSDEQNSPSNIGVIDPFNAGQVIKKSKGIKTQPKPPLVLPLPNVVSKFGSGGMNQQQLQQQTKKPITNVNTQGSVQQQQQGIQSSNPLTPVTPSRASITNQSNRGSQLQYISEEDQNEIDQYWNKEPVHTEKIQFILRHYNAVLDFMKEQGALLAPIKAEYLLSHQNYSKFAADCLISSPYCFPSHPFSEALFAIQRDKKIRQVFAILSFNSWTHLVLQICRCLIFPKINLKRLKQTPGITVLNITGDDDAHDGQDGKGGQASTRASYSKQMQKSPIQRAQSVSPFSQNKLGPQSPNQQQQGFNPLQSGRQSSTGLDDQQKDQYSSQSLQSQSGSSIVRAQSTAGLKRTRPVLSFSTDLSDDTVILACIRQHAPFLNIKINEHPQTEQYRLKNTQQLSKQQDNQDLIVF